MAVFDASREWTILLPSDVGHARKAAEDLSRYIGLLALKIADGIYADGIYTDGIYADDVPKAPLIVDAFDPAPEGAVVILSSNGHTYERNGFSWRAGEDRVEISGESDRGLCNGIYSFLAALGISWPAPGEEKLPTPAPHAAFTLASAAEFYSSEEENPAAANLPAAALRRFVIAGKGEVKELLKKSEAFVEWAARCRYDAIVFPLAAYASVSTGRKIKQVRQIAGEYGIVLEAGGRELSSLVPRRYFFFHRDFFRMDDGKRTKDHHFCPTSPDVTRLIAKEGERLFRFAGEVGVIHLWPDRGAETAWCSCPTCRAFTSLEQNRIAINVAADALAALNLVKHNADFAPFIAYFEKPGEGGKIKPRKNTFSVSEIP
jgi:hypothetical protein